VAGTGSSLSASPARSQQLERDDPLSQRENGGECADHRHFRIASQGLSWSAGAADLHPLWKADTYIPSHVLCPIFAKNQALLADRAGKHVDANTNQCMTGARRHQASFSAPIHHVSSGNVDAAKQVWLAIEGFEFDPNSKMVAWSAEIGVVNPSRPIDSISIVGKRAGLTRVRAATDLRSQRMEVIAIFFIIMPGFSRKFSHIRPFDTASLELPELQTAWRTRAVRPSALEPGINRRARRNRRWCAR
jgi:hypothetical protein